MCSGVPSKRSINENFRRSSDASTIEAKQDGLSKIAGPAFHDRRIIALCRSWLLSCFMGTLWRTATDTSQWHGFHAIRFHADTFSACHQVAVKYYQNALWRRSHHSGYNLHDSEWSLETLPPQNLSSGAPRIRELHEGAVVGRLQQLYTKAPKIRVHISMQGELQHTIDWVHLDQRERLFAWMRWSRDERNADPDDSRWRHHAQLVRPQTIVTRMSLW